MRVRVVLGEGKDTPFVAREAKSSIALKLG